jgi:hypothetical protein
VVRGFHGGKNKIVVLRVMTLCILARRYQRFGEAHCFYRQDRNLLYREDGCYIFSETVFAYQTTRRHKLEDYIMGLCRSEYLTSYKYIFNKANFC